MRKHFLATALATTLIAGSACALVYTPPSTMLDSVPAGTYGIDPAHTNVLFSLNHMGYSRYYGRFDKIDGSMKFDPKDPEKSFVTITIDVASIDTNNTKLQDELKGPQWFDAAKYDIITFTSTSVQKLTTTTGKVTGNLMLHGVSKPVTLDVTFNGGGHNPLANADELGFSATTSIKRSDFGITQYVPMVGDDVNITIETELHKK